MRPCTALLLVLAAMLGGLGGCATPSVHPLYTDDTIVYEPALVGTWGQKDDAQTYSITRVGKVYHLLVKDHDPKKPQQWEFEVRLVKLGDHRYADVAAAEEERDAHEEHWGPLFVPTHMVARFAVSGDALTVWTLRHEWLKERLDAREVSLAHTRLGPGVILITATTAELQAFLRAHADNPLAFDKTELTRRP